MHCSVLGACCDSDLTVGAWSRSVAPETVTPWNDAVSPSLSLVQGFVGVLIGGADVVGVVEGLLTVSLGREWFPPALFLLSESPLTLTATITITTAMTTSVPTTDAIRVVRLRAASRARRSSSWRWRRRRSASLRC